VGIEDQKPVASPSDSKKEPKVCNVYAATVLNGMATTMSAQPAVGTQRARSCGSFQIEGLGTEDKISRVAPSDSVTVERSDVGDVNKGNEDNEILQESKGEQPDLVLQSLPNGTSSKDTGPTADTLSSDSDGSQVDRSHHVRTAVPQEFVPDSDAGLEHGRRSGSPADIREGGANVSPAVVPEAIADEISSTEVVSSVVRDTTMRSGFAPEGAVIKAEDSYYSPSGQGHIFNRTGGECVKFRLLILLLIVQSTTAGCLYFRVLI